MNITEYAIAKKMFGSGGGSGGSGESMIGTWVFNDELIFPSVEGGEWVSYQLVFVGTDSNGASISFDTLILKPSALTVDYYDGASQTELSGIYDDGWMEEFYKTIKILKEPSAETSALIKANAKKKEDAKAYHLSSADDLPADAVDGSLAMVQEDDSDILGAWKFNEEITFTEEIWYFRFESGGDEYDVMGNWNGMSAWEYVNETEGLATLVYMKDEWNDYGWDIDKRAYQTINILEKPEAEAEAWIREHAKKPTILYARVNGKWVNKGEI